MIPLAGGNFALENRDSRIILQAWDEQRSLVRRVVDIREQTRGRLELVVERFAGKRGALFLLDLAQSAGQDWERRGTRLVFREQFRQFLHREFPAWTIAELSTEADLEHSLSPAYPRALLMRGPAGLAAIGAAPDSLNIAGVLSFGLIWLDYLRHRERRIAIEGLLLFLPVDQERTTCLRVRLLNHSATRFEVFAYNRSGHTARLDLQDFGNLDTRLDVCRHPSGMHGPAVDRLLAIGGVERIDAGDGEISLRVRGLEFARTAGDRILFGLGERVAVREANFSECEQLARDLVRLRHAPANGGHLYARNPKPGWRARCAPASRL